MNLTLVEIRIFYMFQTFYSNAIASISTKLFFGKPATAYAALAGGLVVKTNNLLIIF